MLQADVIILGAGTAGATAALNLAAQHRVLLLDHQATPSPRIGESLPPAARRLLRDMGLWESFVQQGHAPCYGNRSVWNGRLAETDFLRDADGHGWHLDRQRFEIWLRDIAQTRGAALLAPASIQTPPIADQGWLLQLQTANGPRPARSRILIDATGRASSLARKLGARRSRQDQLICGWCYGQDHAQAGDKLSHIEATEHGWWYSAALPNNRRVLAFHTDADLAQSKALRQPDWLSTAADQLPELGPRLRQAGFIADTPTNITAAHSASLSPAAANNWLAIGDAALSFDPLSAQGLFNALYTGLAAAEATDRLLGGDTSAIADYSAEIGRIQAAYRQHLQAWYGEEQRWAEAEFWRRRRG